MGKEIVYCQDCGKRLTEDEFGRGKALKIDNLSFCSDCRPSPPSAPAPKPAPPVKSQTAKIPVSSTARLTRPAEPRPGGSRKALLVGGGVGVLAIGVLIAFTVSPGGGPPTAGPDRAASPATGEDRALQALKNLQDFASASPDPEAILLRCDEIRSLLKGTPHEPKLRSLEEQALERRRLKAEGPRLEAALAQAREIRAKDATFDRKEEVLAILRAAAGIAGPRRAEVEGLTAGYERAFEEAAARTSEETRAEASKLAGEGKTMEALARIDRFPASFAKTRHAEAIRALREEIEKKASEIPVGRIELRVASVHSLGGGRFEIVYEWRVGLAPRDEYRAFVHFVDPANEGRILFQNDHPLSPSTPQWEIGQVIRDGPHTLTLPGRPALASYGIRAGLFKGSDRIVDARLGRIRVTRRDGKVTDVSFSEGR